MKKRALKIGLLLAAMLLAAAYMDWQEQTAVKENQIERQPTGSGTREYELNLQAEELIDGYSYSLTVEEVLPEEEQILGFLRQAEEEIEESFWPEGEDASGVTGQVRLEDSYAGGLVEAEWSFDRYDVIDTEGTLREDAIPAEGAVVTAYTQLSCYGVQETYQFSFLVVQREKTGEEQLLADIRVYLQAQQEQAGVSYLELPAEMDGVALTWSIKKTHYLRNMLLLAAVVMIGLKLSEMEKKKQKEKKRTEQLLREYPEIVSKVLLLSGAGMSIRQAWSRICSSYQQKREAGQIEEKPAYEEMLLTNRRMAEGVSESAALQEFGERMGLSCYRRFGRLLLEQLKKGAAGTDFRLERETEDAFEERKRRAKKLGEEAGTKLLLPMMIMLGIVLGIVLVPALADFVF